MIIYYYIKIVCTIFLYNFIMTLTIWKVVITIFVLIVMFLIFIILAYYNKLPFQPVYQPVPSVLDPSIQSSISH